MAEIVADPKSLPERAVPIPGAKPPVFSLPHKDLGNPEEVDAFRKLIRELDARLAEGLADVKAGRVHGPFASAKEASAYIERVVSERRASRKIKRAHR
jgi:hypothetical protein